MSAASKRARNGRGRAGRVALAWIALGWIALLAAKWVRDEDGGELRADLQALGCAGDDDA